MVLVSASNSRGQPSLRSGSALSQGVTGFQLLFPLVCCMAQLSQGLHLYLPCSGYVLVTSAVSAWAWLQGAPRLCGSLGVTSKWVEGILTEFQDRLAPVRCHRTVFWGVSPSRWRAISFQILSGSANFLPQWWCSLQCFSCFAGLLVSPWKLYF